MDLKSGGNMLFDEYKFEEKNIEWIKEWNDICDQFNLNGTCLNDLEYVKKCLLAIQFIGNNALKLLYDGYSRDGYSRFGKGVYPLYGNSFFKKLERYGEILLVLKDKYQNGEEYQKFRKIHYPKLHSEHKPLPIAFPDKEWEKLKKLMFFRDHIERLKEEIRKKMDKRLIEYHENKQGRRKDIWEWQYKNTLLRKMEGKKSISMPAILSFRSPLCGLILDLRKGEGLKQVTMSPDNYWSLHHSSFRYLEDIDKYFPELTVQNSDIKNKNGKKNN